MKHYRLTPCDTHLHKACVRINNVFNERENTKRLNKSSFFETKNKSKSKARNEKKTATKRQKVFSCLLLFLSKLKRVKTKLFSVMLMRRWMFLYVSLTGENEAMAETKERTHRKTKKQQIVRLSSDIVCAVCFCFAFFFCPLLVSSFSVFFSFHSPPVALWLVVPVGKRRKREDKRKVSAQAHR